MQLRFFVPPLVVLLLASAAAFASTTDSAIRPEVQLNDSSAAEEFAEQLPRSLLFDDRMGTAQIAHLSEPLEGTTADPVRDYRAGDVAYWATEQSIVIFLADSEGVPADHLSLIGHISSGLDDLTGCDRNCPVLLEDTRDRPVGSDQAIPPPSTTRAEPVTEDDSSLASQTTSPGRWLGLNL